MVILGLTQFLNDSSNTPYALFIFRVNSLMTNGYYFLISVSNNEPWRVNCPSKITFSFNY